MIPTIGRIVLYTLTDRNAEDINRRRMHAHAHRDEHRDNATGVMVHTGNAVGGGDQFPMVITRLWGPDEHSAINGTVWLDGSDTLWVTSTEVDRVGEKESPTPGKYRWPTRT